MRLIAIMRMVIICLMWFYVYPAFAQTDDFKHGNEAYRKGKYVEAISEYKKIETAQLGGFGLYTNMAKAYAHLKHDALAILYFEKALKIKPNNTTVQHELGAIIKRNPILEERPGDLFLFRWWQGFSGMLMPDAWSIFSLVVLFISGGYFLVQLNQRGYKYQKYVLSIGAVLFCLSSLASISRTKQIYHSDFRIIIAPQIMLQAGPDEMSPSISELPSGTKVKMLDHLGGWILVISPFGDTGWVKSQNAAQI